MRKWILTLAIASLALAGLAIVGCTEQGVQPNPDKDFALQNPPAERQGGGWGKIVVANRGSGTISVIDARTAAVSGTYDLPAEMGEPTPEPMYVVHVSRYGRVFVGDRANNRVAIFDDRTFAVEGTVAAGHGVFHMWADPVGRQLWVNNDIDNTTTVIDPGSLSLIATVPTPADLVGMGGKPHDVILGPHGRLAYVTVLGLAGDNDYVVQFNTSTFAETGRAAVGKDPHVSLTVKYPWLYVPCQNTNEVIVLNRYSMAQVASLAIPGAHGAGMAQNGRTFYTTNLSGGGSAALYAIETHSNSVVGAPVDSPYPVPHNIALTTNGQRLFLTHSGATSDKVTVYRLQGADPTPVYDSEVTVGLNPFGIAFVR
jgi:YVTN family beta-propeller protein